MEILYAIFIAPFIEMGSYPDLFIQALWDGFVAGTLYGLIALGFVLIFKASGVFNFSQPILVVLAALSLVSFYQMGVPAWISVILVLIMFYALAWLVERLILRQLVNQDGNILFMSTIGLTFIIIGAAQWIFWWSAQRHDNKRTGATKWFSRVACFRWWGLFRDD